MPLFVHPLLAAGAIGLVALPILAHLLARRRYEQRPWAAMRFLTRALRRTRRRRRLENFLLLGLRIGAVLLIVAAAARPVLDPSALARLAGDNRVDHVVVLDNSGSMRATVAPGESAFDAARAAVERLVETFPASDGVALLTTVAPHARTAEPIHDSGAVRRVLDGVRCTDHPAALAETFAAAAQVVARSRKPAPLCKVYVFSDLTQRDWLSESPSDPRQAALDALAARSELTFVRVGPPRPDNVAIESLELADRLVARDVPLTLRIRLRNHAPRPSAAATLELRIDSRLVRSAAVEPLPADAARTLDLPIRLERDGAQIVTATLAGQADALQRDDERFLTLRPTAARPVLIVDSPSRGATAKSHFLLRALGARRSVDRPPPFAARAIADHDLPGVALQDFDAIVLNDALALSLAEWRRLERFVSAGGGLLAIADEATSPGDLGTAAARLLPALPVARETVAADAAVTLSIDDWSHPVLVEFAGRPVGGLLAARFRTYWSSELTTGTSRVVARLTGGAPAIIERGVGRGRVMLWTSGVDLVSNGLPARPDFVPLVLNTLAHLAASRGHAATTTVGERMTLALPDGVASLRVRTGNGREISLPRVEHEGHGVVIWSTEPQGPVDEPGVYQVTAGSLREPICVNGDPRESDLSPLEPAALRGRVAPRATCYDDLAAWNTRRDEGRRADASGLMLGALFAVVLLETVLAAQFGHRP